MSIETAPIPARPRLARQWRYLVPLVIFSVLAGPVAAIIAAPSLSIAQSLPKNFVMSDSPKAVATVSFIDGQGQSRSLADFKGKVVVLNIWATWCVPCRREMPALDRLQAALGGPDFQVVPVSIDRNGIDIVRKFFDEINVRNLAIYLDASGQALRALGAVGLPTTLVLDRNGDEIARVVGPAEWDDPAIVEYLGTTSRAPAVSTKAVTSDGSSAPGSSFQWLKGLFTR